ncbi:nucleotide modification associated domain 5 [Bordetella phage PY223]
MRLTKEMRENIIEAAMRKAFKARDDAHDKATTALADALYNYTHGEAEKIAKKLPQGWIDARNNIGIKAAGFGWRNNDLKNYSLKLSKARPFPAYGNRDIPVGGAHPLNEQAQDVAEEFQTIKRDKDALRAKLSALVWSVTTVPRLLEAWPECEQFLPQSTPKQTALVPVQLVPELNAALGIKAKAAK